MDADLLKFELEELKHLHTDIEKQMIEFDEIIPYTRQKNAEIFSPRLLNMILACGPQVEAVSEIIANRCGIKRDELNVPSLIQKINEKGILSKFNIISIQYNLQFTPFTLELDWWKMYNGLKHNLSTEQYKINYVIVMNALAALSALHYLANKLVNAYDNDIPTILNADSWYSEERFIRAVTIGRKPYEGSPFWRSLLFEVRNVYRGW